MNFNSALEICSEQIAPLGTALYYSLRLLNPEQRSALIGLYAFKKALLDISLQNVERQLALSKLNWWRDEVNNLLEGKASHPAAILLQEAAQKYNLHPQRFHNVANAIELDLYIGSYAIDSEITQFFSRSWGEVEVIAANILNRPDIESYRNLGLFYGLMDNLIRIIGKKEKIYISEASLLAYTLDKHELTHINELDTRNFIDQQIILIEKERGSLDQHLLYKNIYFDIQKKILEKIKSKQQLHTRDCYLSPLKMFWIMLQCR